MDPMIVKAWIAGMAQLQPKEEAYKEMVLLFLHLNPHAYLDDFTKHVFYNRDVKFRDQVIRSLKEDNYIHNMRGRTVYYFAGKRGLDRINELLFKIEQKLYEFPAEDRV